MSVPTLSFHILISVSCSHGVEEMTILEDCHAVSPQHLCGTKEGTEERGSQPRQVKMVLMQQNCEVAQKVKTQEFPKTEESTLDILPAQQLDRFVEK